MAAAQQKLDALIGDNPANEQQLRHAILSLDLCRTEDFMLDAGVCDESASWMKSRRQLRERRIRANENASRGFQQLIHR